MTSQQIEVAVVVSEAFQQNSYIVRSSGSTRALVIDPGLDPQAIVAALAEWGLTLEAILITHGHADHIAGNRALMDAFPDAVLVIGAGDSLMLTDADANLSGSFGFPLTSPAATRLIQNGDVLGLADVRLEVIEIPGHSPGHVVYLHRGPVIRAFVGDILFRGSIGRTDFPGGNFPLLMQGVRSKLLTLPEDTIIYPGHGPETTIGLEARTNPFLDVDAV